MKVKMRILFYAFFILLSPCSLTWAEDITQIPAQLKDKNFLTSVKWTDANIVLEIASGWDKYIGKQGIEGKETLREKDIQIYGTKFSVEVRKFVSDGVFEFVFINKGDFPKDLREKFMNYAVETWGVPLKNIDYSSGDQKNGLDNHEVEWLLSDTHIKFISIGAQLYGKWVSTLFILIITQQGKYPLLKDLIGLKCDGQKRLFGFEDSTQITPVSPFVILIDLNHNSLRRRNKSTIGKITQVSNDYFISEWNEKDKKHRFVIDRKLGTYEWKTTPLESTKNYGAIEWGNCEKTNLHLEPKF
jgi:hypothetical protein